jgi:putative tryptophan/tyrosine transport system substrate-binding protein
VRRREFLIGGIAGISSRTASARQQSKVWQIGYLAESPRPTDDVFRQTLRELGYIEGRNLKIFYRWANSGDYKSLAEDLVRQQVDLIVAVASPATRAAEDATQSIPIVMTEIGDPVAYGFVASLARPGGNITGMSAQLSETIPKGLQFMKEIIPTAAKLAMIVTPNNPGTNATVAVVVAAAQTLGLDAKVYGVVKSDDFSDAFAAILRERPDALYVIPDHFLYTQRARIIDFARSNQIPAVYGVREYVTDGGLAALSPDRNNMAIRAAAQVDKILKGAKPAQLPVEQPTKFKVFINLGTARALGLVIPQSILARADEVIE